MFLCAITDKTKMNFSKLFPKFSSDKMTLCINSDQTWLKIFLLTFQRQYFFCGSFVSCVSHAFASVHGCLVVTCLERADLLALVGDVYCIFVLSHVVFWVRCGT